MRGLKLVGNVWLPEEETAMSPFLENPKGFVHGQGTYQYGKMMEALTQCQQRRRVIDVGAHVGTWSIRLARYFEHLDAFEPHPLHRKCWEMNMRIALANQPKLEQCERTLYPFALGPREGWADLSGGIASSGDTWIKFESENTEGRDMQRVEMRKLDSFAFDDVDLIKIDTEGFELFILQGAEQLLRLCKPVVIVEQKPGHAERFGLGQTDACAYLEDLGAKLHREIVGDFIYKWER